MTQIHSISQDNECTDSMEIIIYTELVISITRFVFFPFSSLGD